MIFEEKYFSRYILLTDWVSLPGCLYFLRYWAMCIVFICCTVCDIMNFEINLDLLIKPFFYITKKSRQKCKYPKNKHFSSFLKGFQLPESVSDPRVDL